MSTNRTSNYNLNQWVNSDRVLMSEFNADNAKIDAALKAQDTAIAGKASASALSALQSTVSQHTAALAGKGNCQIYVTSYTGSGKCGSADPNRLTFSKKPMVIFVCGNTSVMTLIQGMGTSWAANSTSAGSAVSVTWSGNTVSWYGDQAYSQMSSNGQTYRVLALLQAD